MLDPAPLTNNEFQSRPCINPLLPLHLSDATLNIVTEKTAAEGVKNRKLRSSQVGKNVCVLYKIDLDAAVSLPKQIESK